MATLIRIGLTVWLLTVIYDETGWATTTALLMVFIWSEVVAAAINETR